MSRSAARLEHLQKVVDSARCMVDELRQALTGAALLESLAIEPLLADAVELVARLDLLRDAIAEVVARAEEGDQGQATAALDLPTSTRESSHAPNEEETLAQAEASHHLIACLRGEGNDLAHCRDLIRSAAEELEHAHDNFQGWPEIEEARVELRRAAELMQRTFASTLADEPEKAT